MSDDPDERARERVGSVLNDKWTLERLIGIGGMAAVYAGVHRNGARAAIKVLHPAYARRKDVRERFLREGYAANRVGHSGVVKVLDDDIIEVGPDEGGAFLVMELLEGQSLEDRLERGPLVDEGEMLAIARAVLDVLDVAHAAGVVHRDLKPENLFLARDPDKPDAPAKIKILDFGLARISERGGKTLAGVAIGTPSYMPPEQAAGRVHDVDARSDLFALGATCFRVLAHRTVHPAEGAMAICARMAKEPAPKLRSVAPDVSEKAAAVIDRALEFRREDRWPNAAAMREALDGAIAALGTPVTTIESGIVEIDPSLPPEPRARRLPASKARRSSSVLSWLVLVGLLAVAAKLAYDRFLAPKPMVKDAADAHVETPAPSATETAVEPVEAAVEGPFAVEEAGLDAESSDATTDAAELDAAVDATADVDVVDAALVPTLVHHDAGTPRHHHDGGARHHHPPHSPHRH